MTRAQKTEYLRSLYHNACGYCGINEAEVQHVLTRDHFRPLTAEGRNSVDNMVYACEECNATKGEYWAEAPEERLLHPLHDDLAEHVRYDSDGTISALSARGAVYIQVLNLNRAALVARRYKLAVR